LVCRAYQVQLDHLEKRDHLEMTEITVNLENQVQEVFLATMETQVLPV